MLTLEDKAIEIPDKNESIKQPANDVYFLKKIKGRHVKNGQKEFFIIKWKLLLIIKVLT